MHSLKIKNILVLFTLSCLVASCTMMDHSGAKPAPSLTFDYLQPYAANGGTTMITQSFTPDKMTAMVTKEFNESPAHIITRYAQSRFVTRAEGGMRQKLIFNIKEASLGKYTSETDPLLFMAGMSQDRYRVKVFLELFPVSDTGQKMDPFTLYYEQDLILSSNASLRDREYAQFEFYETMINDIDKAVSDIVLNKF